MRRSSRRLHCRKTTSRSHLRIRDAMESAPNELFLPLRRSIQRKRWSLSRPPEKESRLCWQHRMPITCSAVTSCEEPISFDLVEAIVIATFPVLGGSLNSPSQNIDSCQNSSRNQAVLLPVVSRSVNHCLGTLAGCNHGRSPSGGWRPPSPLGP
jgi:hypothetical protein